MKPLFTLFFILFAILCSAQSWKDAYDSCLVYQQAQQYKKSLEWGDKALELYEKQVAKKDTNYSSILSSQTENCYYIGFYEIGLEYAKKDSAITFENYGEYNYHFANSCNNLGLLYQYLGFYDLSERLFTKVKVIDAKLLGSEHPEYATACYNLGGLFTDQGRYSDAEPLYIEVKNIRKKKLGNKHPDYADACSNLAGLYRRQGLYEEAESLYTEAKNIYAAALGKGHTFYATACNNLATVYITQNRYNEAILLLNEAIGIIEKVYGKEHIFYANSCNNIAGIYKLQGYSSKAESLYVVSKKIREKVFGISHPAYALICSNLADLYKTQKRYSKSESLYIEAKNINLKVFGKNHTMYGNSCNNLALLYAIQGKYSEAETLFVKSFVIRQKEIENNFKNLSEIEKEKYVEANIENYNHNFLDFIWKYCSQNPSLTSYAYQIAISTKGLILNSTEKIKQRIFKSNNLEIKHLFIEWKNTRDKYNKTLSLTIEQRKQKKLNLDSLEKRANELEKQLALKSEDFAHVFTPKPASWQDIQAILKKNEASIEIIRLNLKESMPNAKDSIVYMALILKKNSQYPQIIQFANGNQLEKEYLINYQRSIRHKIYDPYNYEAFWKPIKEALSGISTVYFSPDGVFHQINLATLQNPETKKYVLDEMQVIPVTNTKDILENKRNYNNKAVYLIGNPKYNLNLDIKGNEKPEQNRSIDNIIQLEGAEKEVKEVSAILKNSTAIIGQEATEEYIKNIKNPRILHIATHGYFKKGQYQTPTQAMLNAGLLFAGVVDYDRMNIRPYEKDDGKLTAFEVMNMELDSTELVVLSACETGLGQASKEGVYGLQRAFKVAGAQTIIMSLWKVNDEATQLLMTKFYENWQKKGMDKRKAFETAQKNLRKQYKEPYYWGAFVMIE